MKAQIPDTRQSLILRLPNVQDIHAWDEFVCIYEPLVYRLVKARGLQDADANEVVQEVLLSVSQAVERWDPSAERGRFRDWLFRIARNLTINFLTRPKHRPIGTGDSRVAQMLQNVSDPNSEDSAEFDLAYRREIFRWAADQVRKQVTANTWDAFWQTSILAVPVATAALNLGMTAGAVHIARSRVLGRLRHTVKNFEA